MSHVLPSTWYLIIYRCFYTHNWFLIFPASIGDNLRNPPLYSDGRVKHHIHGRSDSYSDLLDRRSFLEEEGFPSIANLRAEAMPLNQIATPPLSVDIEA